MGANNLNTTGILRKMSQRRRSLMRRLGNNSKNFFVIDNFEAQGFIDDGVEKWKPVKTKLAGQRILIDKGRLRRSGRSRVVRVNRAVVSFEAPYASFVNKTRQIIGDSVTLDGQNRVIVERHYNAIFKR